MHRCTFRIYRNYPEQDRAAKSLNMSFVCVDSEGEPSCGRSGIAPGLTAIMTFWTWLQENGHERVF